MLTDTRKSTERRAQDRRQVDYEFSSPVWIEHVKKNYVAWPKSDRRQSARRTSERRQNDPENLRSFNAYYNPNADYASDLLSEEERLFFESLFNQDSR